MRVLFGVPTGLSGICPVFILSDRGFIRQMHVHPRGNIFKPIIAGGFPVKRERRQALSLEIFDHQRMPASFLHGN